MPDALYDLTLGSFIISGKTNKQANPPKILSKTFRQLLFLSRYFIVCYSYFTLVHPFLGSRPVVSKHFAKGPESTYFRLCGPHSLCDMFFFSFFFSFKQPFKRCKIHSLLAGHNLLTSVHNCRGTKNYFVILCHTNILVNLFFSFDISKTVLQTINKVILQDDKSEFM